MKQLLAYPTIRFYFRLAFAALALCSLSQAMMAVEAITVTTTSVIRTDSKIPIGTNLALQDADSARPARVQDLAVALGNGGGQNINAKFLRWNTMNYLWTTKSATNTAPITRTDVLPSPLAPLASPLDQWWMQAAGAVDASGRFVNGVDFNGFLALCQQIGAEPVVVIPVTTVREVTGNAASVTQAQMLEATLAQLRYANFVQTIGPKVKYWEIGNETYQSETVTPYIAQLQTFSAAMRAIDPTISIGAVGYTSAWNTTMVAQAASSFDFIVDHQYPYYDYTGGYATYAASAALNYHAMPAVQAILNAPVLADRTRLKVMVNELNAYDWNGWWTNYNNLGHAVANFDLTGQMLREPKNIAAFEWATRWIGSVKYQAGTTFNGVTNGTFSSGLAGWSGTLGTVTGGKLTSNGTQAMNRYRYVSGLTAGSNYTLSFTASDTTPANWSAVSLYFYNAAGVDLGKTVSLVLNVTGSKVYSEPFTVPAGTASTLINLYASASSKVTYDNVAVTDRVVPSVWDLVDPVNKINPIGRSMALWGQFYQGTLVATTETSKVHSYASLKADGTLIVWLVNRPTTASTASLSLGTYIPAGTTCQKWTFSGTGSEDPVPTWTTAPSTIALSSLSSLSLPAVSITVLKFTKAP